MVPLDELDMPVTNAVVYYDDFLDLPSKKRAMRLRYVGFGSSLAVESVNASEKRLRDRGVSLWADEADEDAEADFPSAPQKASGVCREEAGCVTPSGSRPTGALPPTDSSNLEGLEKRLEALLLRAESLPSGSTRSPNATPSSKKRRLRKRPSEDGQPQTGQQQPKGAQPPTRPASEKPTQRNPQPASSPGSSSKRHVRFQLQDTLRTVL
jgi:hypothetical protein